MLLLFQNLLSCPLPHHVVNRSSGDLLTLVALGNEFPLDGWPNQINAKWLHEWDSASTHLFEPYPRPWVRQLVLYLCCVVLTIVLECCLRRREGTPTPQLWIKCQRLCAFSSVFAMFHIALLWLSDNIHTCANPLLQITLAEKLVLDNMLLGVLVFALVHCFGGIFGTLWLRRASPVPSDERSDSHPRRKPLKCHMCWIWRTFCFFLVWATTILVLHVPTLIYLMGESLPTNSSFGIGPVRVMVLRYLMSPWLVFSSEWLIPKLSVWLTSWYYTGVPIRRGSASITDKERLLEEDQATCESRNAVIVKASTAMILVSQLVVMALAPILSELLIHDKCLGLVRVLWEPCRREPNVFDIVAVATNAHIAGVPVVSRDEVCGVGWALHDAEMCSRAVIASTSLLNISKVTVQTLFVLLRGCAILVAQRFSRRVQRWPRPVRWAVEAVVAPNEAATTRSLQALVLVGLIYGGVAPLSWLCALAGAHATILMWRCSGQKVLWEPPASRVMWAGLAVHLALSGSLFLLV
eukprot:c11466_g1_i1.p1 GENE.c11466_g1_i1~~c11466_g1_i1.p1  ORF type:complete len:523 (+),score=64.66 c11466_g1_i1:1330-2898(+)